MSTESSTPPDRLERFFDYSIVKTATPAVSNSNYVYNIPVSFNVLKSKSIHNCFLLSTNIFKQELASLIKQFASNCSTAR